MAGEEPEKGIDNRSISQRGIPPEIHTDDQRGLPQSDDSVMQGQIAKEAIRMAVLVTGLRFAEIELVKASNAYRRYTLAISCIQKAAEGPGVDPLETIRFANRFYYPAKHVWNMAIKALGGKGAQVLTKELVGTVHEPTFLRLMSDVITNASPVYLHSFVRTWILRAAALTRADFTGSVKLGLSIIASILPLAEKLRLRDAALHYRTVGKADQAEVLRILTTANSVEDVILGLRNAETMLIDKTEALYIYVNEVANS